MHEQRHLHRWNQLLFMSLSDGLRWQIVSVHDWPMCLKSLRKRRNLWVTLSVIEIFKLIWTKISGEKVTNETYRCHCSIGSTGDRCHLERNCQSECHKEFSHCVNEEICACLPNQHSNNAYCDAIVNCDISNLCLNGGTCITTPDKDGYYCECPPDFTGLICDEKVTFILFLWFLC